jgi:hypothetical protein
MAAIGTFIQSHKAITAVAALAAVGAGAYNYKKGKERGLEGGAAAYNTLFGSPLANHIETASAKKHSTAGIDKQGLGLTDEKRVYA